MDLVIDNNFIANDFIKENGTLIVLVISSITKQNLTKVLQESTYLPKADVCMVLLFANHRLRIYIELKALSEEAFSLVAVQAVSTKKNSLCVFIGETKMDRTITNSLKMIKI